MVPAGATVTTGNFFDPTSSVAYYRIEAVSTCQAESARDICSLLWATARARVGGRLNPEHVMLDGRGQGRHEVKPLNSRLARSEIARP